MASRSSSRTCFSIATVDQGQLGRLDIPSKKIAAWINFLAAPNQQAQIVSAEQNGSSLTLYFQANADLYSYLEERLNGGSETHASAA